MTGHKLHVMTTEHKAGGRVATVTVENAERANCIGGETATAIRDAFADIASDDGIRAAILTGSGSKAFMAGADLRQLGSFEPDTARAFITALHQACDAIRTCPVPVIARINGFCLGAGLELAVSCDLRVATDTARFSMPEVHMGLPSVIEAALLPSLIGWGRTREMLLTGRMYSAAEAREIGLIERVVPDEYLNAAVDGWLAEILKAAPVAIRSQKALISRWERSSLAEGIAAGIDALAGAYTTGEPQQRIAEYFANRPGDKSK